MENSDSTQPNSIGNFKFVSSLYAAYVYKLRVDNSRSTFSIDLTIGS